MVKRIVANAQAPDSASGPAAEAETESKRKKVSKRDFLDTAGAVVDKIEEATGARYTLIGGGPNGANRDFDMQFGEAGQFATMCAIFGFVTKVGNVANTVLNDKDSPGTPGEAAEAIDEFIGLAEQGKWAERATGVGGAKVDRAALAEAIVQYFEETHAAGGMTDEQFMALPSKDKVLEGLNDNPVKVRQARQNDRVLELYNKIVGKDKPQKTAADLAGMF